MTDVTIGSAYRILGYFENCQADHILPKNELLRRFEKDGGSPLDFVVGLQQAIDRGWLKASRDIMTRDPPRPKRSQSHLPGSTRENFLQTFVAVIFRTLLSRTAG